MTYCTCTWHAHTHPLWNWKWHWKGHGFEHVRGTRHEDVIELGDGNYYVHSYAGNDVIIAGNGDNKIFSGKEDDQITVGDGNNYIFANLGNDMIMAGDGDNYIRSGHGDDVIMLGDGRNKVKAHHGDDTVYAGDGGNLIFAGKGHDYVVTGAGDDLILAGSDNDIVYSGAGHDWIFGERGDDAIFAGVGNDVLVGGRGDDLLDGGDGVSESLASSSVSFKSWDGQSDDFTIKAFNQLGETQESFLNITNSGLGVKADPADETTDFNGANRELGYDEETDRSESIEISFDKDLARAELKLAAFFSDSDSADGPNNEYAKWEAYNEHGKLVGEGELSASDGNTIVIEDIPRFNMIRLSALPYNNENSGILSDSSDYYIESLDYEYYETVHEATVMYDFAALTMDKIAHEVDFEIRAYELDDDGVQILGEYVDTSDGLGVKGATGGPANQLGYDEGKDNSERLEFEFRTDVNSVTVDIARLFSSESGGNTEFMYWEILKDGQVIDSGSERSPDGSINTSFTVSADAFDTIAFEALPYNNQNNDNVSDSSDYFISKLTATYIDYDKDIAVFRGNRDDYTITHEVDDDGRDYLLVVDSHPNRDGTDKLYDIEILSFKDCEFYINEPNPNLVNHPPTVMLTDTVTSIPEDADISSNFKVANIVVTDDGLGVNDLSLNGDDKDLFVIIDDMLFLKAGTELDHETLSTLSVSVDVDDAAVGSTPDDTASLVIDVTDVNEVPEVLPETVDLVIDEDTELDYDIPVDQFSDPDGDMLTLSLGTAPDWVSIENGQLVGTPPENFNTDGMPPLTIELIATDPDGLNVTQLISLTVNPVNDAPEVDEIIPDIIMDEDTEVLDLMISPNAFKDVDGDDLTITLENAPDWVTLVDGKLDLIPPANLFGNFTIDIVATDPGGLSATQTVNVVVNQIDEPVEPKPNDDFDLRYMDGEEDLDGGDGNDTARYVDDTVAKDIRINREDDGSFTITEVEQDENGIFQQDNLKDIENFEVGGKSYDYDDDPNAEGTQNNDLLLGSDQADTIHGKAGSDLVYAGDGDDIIYGDQNPDGSSDDDQPLPPKVLYKPDGETLSAEEIAEAQAVDLSDLEFGNAPSTTVDLSFISEGAGYKNMLGYYLYDESGCVVETAILGKDNPLAYNLSAVGSGGSYQTGDTIDSITIGAGLKLGLFLLPDAVGRNSSSDIASKDVAFYRVDENGDLLLDIDGKPMPATINMVDGSGEDANGLSAPRLFFIESDGSLSPVHTKTSDNASYHTTAEEDLDYSLNPDGVVHALNGVAAPDGTITIAFEDLRGGGDEDYDDLIITLNNAVTYDDIIFGGKGDDTIYGDQGDDCLVGEEGDDELRGGTGDDRLVGGDGNDLLVGDECDVQQICASGQTAADWEGISLTAVKLGETLDLFENVDFSDPRGLGVKGGGDSELDYGQNSSEQLIMTFDGKVVLKAEVVVEALFSDEGEGEVGEWIAMRDGQEVGRGTFADDMGDTDGTLTVKIVASEPFDQLIFAARPLGDFAGTQTLEDDGDSSDYHIASIKYDFVNEAEFLANAGNDVLEGGRGDDVLEGGRGDDILDGGEDGETIVETLSYDFGAMSLADAKAIPDTELTISVFDQFGVENPDGTFGESDLTLLTDTNQGLGVNAETGGPKVQLGYDPVENTSEAIRFDFANTATKATLELARLFETESRGDDRSEYAKWAVFNGDSLVASGLVVADPGQNIVSFDIIDVGEFDALVLTAVPYGGTSQTSTSDSSDYLIKSLSVETVISVDDDVDIAVFKGACHEYIFTVKTDDSGREYIEVVDTIPGRDGTDILYDIEQFRFKGEPGGVVTKTFEELCNTNGGDIVNPIAVDDMATTDINVPVTFTPEELLNNDIDDGMVGLAIATVFNPVNGNVEIDTDGNVVFTPAQDYVGNEATFEYTLTNGGDIGKVFVNVVDVPENPVAVDDMATTEVDVPVTFTPEQLLGNDIDEDMVGLAIATVMNPVNGTVDIDQDGNVVFTPSPGYFGNEATFEYTLTNGGDVGKVFIDVIPENPVAVDDMASTDINVPVTFTPEQLLGNDIDEDMVGLAIATVMNPVNGTVDIDQNGNVVFTPSPGYLGNEATFEYTLTNGGDVGKVFIDVTNTGQFAIVDAMNDGFVTSNDTPLTLNIASLTQNDLDFDGDPNVFSADIVKMTVAGQEIAINSGDQNPTSVTIDLDHGALQVFSNGVVVYLPDSSLSETVSDTFDYTLQKNGSTIVDDATVAIVSVSDSGGGGGGGGGGGSEDDIAFNEDLFGIDQNSDPQEEKDGAQDPKVFTLEDLVGNLEDPQLKIAGITVASVAFTALANIFDATTGLAKPYADIEALNKGIMITVEREDPLNPGSMITVEAGILLKTVPEGVDPGSATNAQVEFLFMPAQDFFTQLGTQIGEPFEPVGIEYDYIDNGNQIIDSVKVAVKEINDAPVLDVDAPGVITPDSETNMVDVDLDALFSDVDGDELVYTLSPQDESDPMPSWLMISGGRLIGDPTGVEDPAFALKIKADDGRGGTATYEFIVDLTGQFTTEEAQSGDSLFDGQDSQIPDMMAGLIDDTSMSTSSDDGGGSNPPPPAFDSLDPNMTPESDPNTSMLE